MTTDTLRGALDGRPLRADGLTHDQPGTLSTLSTHLRWVSFVVALVIGLALGGGLSMLAPEGDARTTVAALGQLVGSIGGYVAMLAFERRLAHPFELRGRRGLHGAWVGLAVGAVLMLVCTGVLTVAGLRVFEGTNPDVHGLGWQLLQVGLIAGVSEEIIFRGVIYRLIERGLGTWWAMAISGVIFGAAHLANPEGTWWGALAIAIEAGLMFAVLYAITRNLVLMMGIHAAWNVVQGPLLGSVVSGTATEGNGLLRSHPHGPTLLSGGTFGIEASLITVVLLSVVTVVGARWLHRHGRVVAPARVRNARAEEAEAQPIGAQSGPV
ncbi:lysostaphin resistance A-like protein [Aestuariimicrobium soli]|uniref:CPBP family intramembrane glutamic endopeptidase n=1 Tax=Aestuariimicrobium soli TaxID=2035834 RepID=UPI003EBE7EFA